MPRNFCVKYGMTKILDSTCFARVNFVAFFPPSLSQISIFICFAVKASLMKLIATESLRLTLGSPGMASPVSDVNLLLLDVAQDLLQGPP